MPLPILKHIKAKTIEKPVIDPHYFRTEFGKVTCGLDTNNLFNFDCPDLRSLVETIKFARRLAQQEPLKNIFEGKSKSFFVIFAFD